MGDTRVDNVAVWKYIFICFTLLILCCSIRNYVVYFLYNTASCNYLCPSFLGRNGIVLPWFLQNFFDFQSWLIQLGQDGFGVSGYDKRMLLSSIIVAPVIEEIIYRGPLFVLRRYLHLFVWWCSALFLSVLFALSHGFAGLSLLPFIVLGLASSWLILRTKRFWPSLVLHSVYNFHVVSYPLYQSLFWGD